MQTSWDLEGIRCLSTNATQTRSFWAFEAYKLIAETRVHALSIEAGLRQKGILRLSRERLKEMHAKLEQQLSHYQRLLSPLGWQSIEHNAYVSYLSQTPGSSFLAGNFDNLFRDWAWGDAENALALQMIRDCGGSLPAQQDLLVLGAGACRLAYDVHREFNLKSTYAVDYNPLLLLAAQKLIRGESLELVEFPIVPTTAQDFAIQRTLRAPAPAPSGLQLILADLRDLSLELPKTQNILTPWLIDVVKIDFNTLVQKLNSLLPMGGRWLSFGPLGFNNPLLSDYYSYEEVLHLINKNGFKIGEPSYRMIPYLQSPSSNSHRLERVLCFSAEKVEDVELSPPRFSDSLPWESDPNAPIDIAIEAMRLQQGHEFNAYVASLLSQKPTFSQLLQEIIKKYNLPPEQTAYMVHQVLRGIHYQSLANPLGHN